LQRHMPPREYMGSRGGFLSRVGSASPRLKVDRMPDDT